MKEKEAPASGRRTHHSKNAGSGPARWRSAGARIGFSR